MAAFGIMMERTATAQRNENQVALGSFSCLADGFRHFARLAMTEANTALLIADNDERREAEALAALHDLGDAVDVNELVDKFAVALFPIPGPFARFTCHCFIRSVRALQALSH